MRRLRDGRDANGALPLLAPMSEIAGRLAAQAGAYFLEKPLGGRGLLLGGVAGVAPGRVLVIGGGIVGYNAAVIAIGLGANVTILERSIDRMRHLDEILSGRVSLVMSSTLQIEESVREADVVIGAVLIPGARAPKLITRAMLGTMKTGAVFCDVAIDQGGCAETSQADDPHRARLRRRRGHALLRREHAGRRADHLDEGADERDAAVRRGDRRPRPRRSGRTRPGARRGRQRARRQGHVPGGRRGARPRVRAARGRPRLAGLGLRCCVRPSWSRVGEIARPPVDPGRQRDHGDDEDDSPSSPRNVSTAP